MASLAGCTVISGLLDDESDGTGNGDGDGNGGDTDESTDTRDDEKAEGEATVSISVDGDWPTFQYDAANTGTAGDARGPVDGVEQLWSYTVDDRVTRGPAIGDGIAYVGSWDDSLYAFALEDGDLEWSFDTGGGVSTASPVVVPGGDSSDESDGAVVFVGNTNGNLHAVDAAEGEPFWTVTLPASVRSSATLADGVLYVGCSDDHLYALSAADGSREWSFRTSSPVAAHPTVVDDTVYVQSHDDYVYAIDTVDGDERWKYDLEGAGGANSPTVVGGTLFVGDNNGNLHAVDAEMGDEEWVRRHYSTAGTPAVVDGSASSSGSLDGADDGIVYLPAGKTAAFDAATGDELWSVEIDGTGCSSGTVVGDLLYFGTDEKVVYALDTADGAVRWRYDAEYEVWASVAVAEGVLVYGDRYGNVVALAEP